jgi:cell division protein FtsX
MKPATMSAIGRGLRNPFRNRARTAIVVLLLAVVVGLFAVMVQGTLLTREQLARLEASVRTVIELREAGAFGTGGFGGDKPIGADEFSVATLDAAKRISSARHVTKIEEYVHAPQIDPTKPNAYAMIIGLRPGAPLRAIGEVDYENARIVAGRGLNPEDEGHDVAVVGRLYARERLGIADAGNAAVAGARLALEGTPLAVVGVYTTGNDFGDNHVFVPIETFRRLFRPGAKLSKIRVTVDSVANVETVADELRRLKGVDVVTAAEQVATAKAALGGMAAATFYGAALLFAIGGVLVGIVMTLAFRERVREIGTLKAIGASNGEIAAQFLAETAVLVGLAMVGGLVVAALAAWVLGAALDLAVDLDGTLLLLILVGGFGVAVLGSGYPIVKGVRLSPMQAMREA